MSIERFKQKFIDEAHDLINNLENFLIDLEDNPDNMEIVQQIFRVMHTLKGISGMYGFDAISDITHHLENIYDQIRNNEAKLTAGVVSITLKTVDHLRNLLADEKLEDNDNIKLQEEIMSEIKLIVDNADDLETKIERPRKDEPSNVKTYYVIFNISESLLHRRINILALFEDLCEIGEYEIIKHDFSGSDSDSAWGIYIATDQGINSIEDVFVFVLDDCRILKVSDHNLFNYEDFINKIKSINLENSESINAQIEEFTEKTQIPIHVEKEKERILATEETPVKDNEEDHEPKKKLQLENIGKQITSRIQVDSEKLDKLMYLVSELVTTKAQMSLVAEQRDYIRLNSLVEKLDDLSRQFRDNTLSIRLVPVLDMIMPFKRLIRDLSKGLDKEVKFITEGTDTELDKNIIDRLAEPVMHIIRNCIDHGIETPAEREKKGKPRHGIIRFSSYYSGANVYIQIQDDGAGIDPKKIRKKAIERGLMTADEQKTPKELYDYLFLPGFSTAKNVTEISGRGVGMDIVKRKIAEIRGEIEVDSEINIGTNFTIKLNQTISIIDTLLVEVGKSSFLIPLNEIDLCEQETHHSLFDNQNRRVQIENELVPFIYLRDEFMIQGEIPEKEKLIIINRNNKRVALVADRIIGEHQAVLKPLGDIFKSQEFLSGASILGDGNLALMLDTNKLMKVCLQ